PALLSKPEEKKGPGSSPEFCPVSLVVQPCLLGLLTMVLGKSLYPSALEYIW
ncbi:hypothetical protein J6590_095777, partial [Homalodisca vitripennis]